MDQSCLREIVVPFTNQPATCKGTSKIQAMRATEEKYIIWYYKRLVTEFDETI